MLKKSYLISRILSLFLSTFSYFGNDVYGQTCQGTLAPPTVHITFGSDPNKLPIALPLAEVGASTLYNFQTKDCPNDGNYTVCWRKSECFDESWYTNDDHTPGDSFGRMFIYNASRKPGIFYTHIISGLAPNTTYEFGAWIANLMKPSGCANTGGNTPNLTFRVESITGALLGEVNTGNMVARNALTWEQFKLMFKTPDSHTQVIVKITNNTPGGCGNDLLLDDLTFRPCRPTLTINAPSKAVVGKNQALTLSASIGNGGFSRPEYQWQESYDNGVTWDNIIGATSLSVTINPQISGNVKYRVLAAELGNIWLPAGQLASATVSVKVIDLPVAKIPDFKQLRICSDCTVDFTDFTTQYPNATYSWTLDNPSIGLGQTSGTGQIPTFKAATVLTGAIRGVFTVIATVDGVQGLPQTFTANVCPVPKANAGPDQSIFKGASTSITASATGGTPGYVYLWNGDLGYGTTKTVWPTANTSYVVTVTDAKGFESKDTIVVSVKNIPVITGVVVTKPTGYGRTNGRITVNATGVGPLQYSTNGTTYQASNVFLNIASGQYTIYVKAADGGIAKQAVNVSQPAPINVVVTVVNNPTVAANRAPSSSVILNLSGGTEPFTYSWSDGTNTFASLVGKPAGSYQLTITDANGEVKTVLVTVPNPVDAVVIGISTEPNPIGSATGGVKMLIDSAVQIASYSWSNGTTTKDLSGAASGNYTLTLTDNNGTKIAVPMAIAATAPIVIDVVPISPTCFGGHDAKISVMATGGKGDFIYALCEGSSCINFGPDQIGGLFENLLAGTYRVRATDIEGNMGYTQDIIVTNPAKPTASATSNSPVCQGATLNLTATDIGAGATYQWIGPFGYTAMGLTVNRTSTSPEMAGEYTLLVIDAKGCQNTTKINIGISPKILVDAGLNQTICDGASVILKVTATENDPTKVFEWNNGLGVGDTKIAKPTITTDYVVKVSTASGCVAYDTVKVTVQPKPTLYSIVAPLDTTICAGVGGVEMKLNGSQTGIVYELLKDNVPTGEIRGGTGGVLSFGLQFAGTYQIKASSATIRNCSVLMTGTKIVRERPPLTVGWDGDDYFCRGEIVHFKARGGANGGYKFLWEDGNTDSVRTLPNQESISLQVTDSVGCIVLRDVAIWVNAQIKATLTASKTAICPNEAVTLTTTTTDGSANVSYTWSDNGSVLQNRTVNPVKSTTYTVYVHDLGYGCEDSTKVSIKVTPDQFNVLGGGSFCSGSPTPTPITISGSEAGINYQLKRNDVNVGGVVAGTGTPLSFGSQTLAGTYTVQALSAACNNTMAGQAVIAVGAAATYTIDSTICDYTTQKYTIYGKTNGIVASNQGTLTQGGGIFKVIDVTNGTNTNLTFTLETCSSSTTVNSPVCSCPTLAPPTLTPATQSFCVGDTVRAIVATVPAGATVDWYGASGTLLRANALMISPKSGGAYYAETRMIASGCKSASRSVATAVMVNKPSFKVIGTAATCTGNTANADAKITIQNAVDGDRYAYSLGQSFSGTTTYGSATQIPTNGVILNNIANPNADTYFTVRVLNGTGCYADSVVKITKTTCNCSTATANVTITPVSQVVCAGENIQEIRATVGAGIAVDWYSATGTLLKSNSLTFTPTMAGEYYAEGRVIANGCKSTERAIALVSYGVKPSYEVIAESSSCTSTTANNDGKITLVNLTNGTRFAYTTGQTYSGTANYGNATAVPANRIILQNIANPAADTYYTIRVFNNTGCYFDQTVMLKRANCAATSVNAPTVVPQSQTVCQGDTFQTVRATTISTATVDWYDANGILVLAGSLSYKPTKAGNYFAEARIVASDIKSTTRTSFSALNSKKPEYTLKVNACTCSGATANSDGNILILDATTATGYNYSEGTTFNNSTTTRLSIPIDKVLLKNIPNIAKKYTIRVYNACGYTDQTVDFTATDCQCIAGPCVKVSAKKKKK